MATPGATVLDRKPPKAGDAAGREEPGSHREIGARDRDAGGDQAKLPLLVVDRAGTEATGTTLPTVMGRLAVLRRLKYLPILLLLPLGGLIGMYFQPPGLQFAMRTLGIEPGGGTSTPIAIPSGRPPGGGTVAVPPPPKTVAGLGVLLPRGEVLTIAPPYGAGDARVASLEVEEGQRVGQGDILATLDSVRAFEAAASTAKATVAARRATLGQVREATIASRDEANAALARSEAAVVNTKREFERAEQLVGKGYTSQATYDAKRAANEQAVQDIERARATLKRYAGDDIDAQADVVVAKQNLAVSEAELARAEADLAKAYVRAPIAGSVLTIHAWPGEKPGDRGIMTFGNIDDMTAEVEVYQTLIGRVEVGAPVTISADALPDPLAGTVSRVGLEVGRQTLTDATPAANTEARVVKVYVALDPASAEVASRFSNLQVIARIGQGATQ